MGHVGDRFTLGSIRDTSGTNWGHFGNRFGSLGGSISVTLGTDLGHFGDQFGTLRGPIWDTLGTEKWSKSRRESAAEAVRPRKYA